MSAKSYGDCPVCRTKHADEAKQIMNDMCSSTSYDEIIKMQARLREINDHDLGTLAEYYEHWFEGTEFRFRYNCHCEQCGFEYTHNNEAVGGV